MSGVLSVECFGMQLRLLLLCCVFSFIAQSLGKVPSVWSNLTRVRTDRLLTVSQV